MPHWTDAPSPTDAYVLHGRALFPLYERPTDEVNEAFKVVPGVYIDWRKNAVEVPVHMVGVIGQAVEHAQLGTGSFYWHGMTQREDKDVEAKIACAELHPGLWDGSNPAVLHPSPLQREAIRWAVLRRGGNLWHPPGAGKTIQAAIIALADGHGQSSKPPLVVAVTRASVRIHWGNEISKVSPSIRPWVSDPSRRQRKDWFAACGLRGTRTRSWSASFPHRGTGRDRPTRVGQRGQVQGEQRSRLLPTPCASWRAHRHVDLR